MNDAFRQTLGIALIPLRVAVNVGSAVLERFDEAASAPEPPPASDEESVRSETRTSRLDPQRSARPKPWLDDAALARKVESVIFRDQGIAKGKIDVNAADGVVWLRGQAKTPDLIKQLEEQAANVPEVRRVENLLHLPKTPAPSRTDTPASQRKTRRSRAEPAKRRTSRGRVTAERKAPGKAEPQPKQRAARRQGRGPAPLGARSEQARKRHDS